MPTNLLKAFLTLVLGAVDASFWKNGRSIFAHAWYDLKLEPAGVLGWNDAIVLQNALGLADTMVEAPPLGTATPNEKIMIEAATVAIAAPLARAIASLVRVINVSHFPSGSELPAGFAFDHPYHHSVAANNHFLPDRPFHVQLPLPIGSSGLPRRGLGVDQYRWPMRHTSESRQSDGSASTHDEIAIAYRRDRFVVGRPSEEHSPINVWSRRH